MRKLVLSLAAALSASAAGAQGLPAFDLERLRLDPAAHGSLVVGDGETGPAGSGRFSIALHYERQPLVLFANGAQKGHGFDMSHDPVGDVVGGRLTVHGGLAYAITDHLEVLLSVPVIPWQRSDDLTAFGVPRPKENGIGSISGGLRIGVLKEATAGINVALAGDVLLDWGTVEAVAGNKKVAFTPRLELGKHLSEAVVLAVHGGGLLRVDDPQIPIGNGQTKGLGHEAFAGVALAATNGPLTFEVSGRGAWNFNDFGASYEALAGIRLRHGVGELFVLGGPGFDDAPGTPRFRGLVGFALNFEPEKPPPPPPAAPPPAPTPPPPPPPNPCDPGQSHTPEQCPDLDDDGDGIPNGQDACPLQPGIPELKGCPDKDTDGDGIPDRLDKCPTVPGVAEYQGCPAPEKAEIQKEGGVTRIAIKDSVYFDSNQATIQPRSYALLDDVAKVLQGHPELKKVVVEGHTDSRGSKALNTKLSQARAAAVRDYLVGKGVDPARIDAKGYGPTRPIADNKTAAGREKNRRVDFVAE